jgi:hypothetical protein
MIEIESSNKNEADRLADLIAEQSALLKTFLLCAMEKLAAEDGSEADMALPTIHVTNTSLSVGN